MATIACKGCGKMVDAALVRKKEPRQFCSAKCSGRYYLLRMDKATRSRAGREGSAARQLVLRDRLFDRLIQLGREDAIAKAWRMGFQAGWRAHKDKGCNQKRPYAVDPAA